MNAQETQAQERVRLLRELHDHEQGYSCARRLQRWPAAQACAEEVARVSKLLDLNATQTEEAISPR